MTYPATLTAGLLIVILSTGPASAQEPPDATAETALAIERTVAGIHEVRSDRIRARESHRTGMEAIDPQIDRLKADLERVAESVQDEQEQITVLSGSMAAGEDKTELREAALVFTATSALRCARSMRDRIAEGIPYRRPDRLGQLDRILSGLESPEPGLQARAVSDLLAFAGEELTSARKIELWNEPVLLEGGTRKIHAYQVRIGLVAQYFLSEDGRWVGMANPGGNPEWVADLDRETAHRIREIFDVLRSHRPPQLVSVPLRLSAGSEDPRPVERED